MSSTMTILISGSPFSVPMIDVGGIRLSGDKLMNLVSAHQMTSFSVATHQGFSADLNVRIIGKFILTFCFMQVATSIY